jgi:hypothetical protein
MSCPVHCSQAEALRLFRKTCGEDSPLTANAMGCLGKLHATRGPSRRREALGLLRGALNGEVRKDAFHLDTVWELLSKIKDVQLELAAEKQEREASVPGTSRQAHLASLETAFSVYLPVIREACARVASSHATSDTGTVAVFYKTAGELAMLAQDYKLGREALDEVRGTPFPSSHLVLRPTRLPSPRPHRCLATRPRSTLPPRSRRDNPHHPFWV